MAKKIKTRVKLGPREALMKKHDKIFRQRDLDMRQTCMCWGLECGVGWLPLIDDLCGSLQWNTDKNGHPQVEAVQVKEKFGTLRFYWQVAGDWKPDPKRGGGRKPDEAYAYIEGMVDAYESISGHTCEDCGERGRLCSTNGQSSGWLRTLCPKCAPGQKYKPLPKRKNDRD